jgi:F-type H+-transporting ATPase subunit b
MLLWLISKEREMFVNLTQTIRDVLTKARADHRAVVQERMDHIGKLSNISDTTNALYDMSKEIAQMEAQVFKLKQQVAFTSDIKSVLDAWVRHEANVREQEQKTLVADVIGKVKSKLADPKFVFCLKLATIHFGRISRGF